MGFNLGNFAGQLGLNEQEQDQAQANVAGTMGTAQPAAQPTDQQVSQTAQTDASKVANSGQNSLATAQQYVNLANSLGDDEESQNGLSKVLGLVSLF